MKKIYVFTIVLCCSLYGTKGQVPEADSLSLVALYNSTSGPTWTNSTNWLQPGQPVSSWVGITVANDTVIEILIQSNNLAGNIPDEIGNFTGLEVLNLYDNELSGPIPSTIGNLSKLTNLFLRKNHLSDTIPEEIGNLTNLHFLRLCDNELTGPIPSRFGYLANLEYLLISNNQLSGSIPEEIGNLANLKEINLSNNELSGPVPETIGGLGKIKYLYLDHNQLNGSIPATIGDMKMLTNVRLGNNQFTGSIPAALGNLENLESIELIFNQLTDTIPPEIGNLGKLRWLSLMNNQLTGSIPFQIGDLDSLRTLYLSDNLLSGPIPPEIGNLVKLESVSVYNNELSGNIPEEIGNLRNLEYLFLSNNHLTGEIPDALGQLNKLVYLQFDNNRLYGTIPGEIKDFPNLTKLSVNKNNFTFSGLEPIAGNSIANFSYNPQHPVGINLPLLNLSSGDSLNLSMIELATCGIEAVNNQYRWVKNGIAITDYTDTASLKIENLEDSHQGFYYCTMINSDFPMLTLSSDSIKLVIDGPTDILLSDSTIDENSAVGTIIGTLSTQDPDQAEGHSYNLVAGDGINDADNSVFSIDGTVLAIQTVPDYEIKQAYRINIRTTDDDMKILDKAFLIQVNDIVETHSNDNALTEYCRIYPNPAGNSIFLEIHGAVKAYYVYLTDISSNILYSREYDGNSEIAMHQYPSGVYFLRIVHKDNTDNTETVKIVKK